MAGSPSRSWRRVGVLALALSTVAAALSLARPGVAQAAHVRSISAAGSVAAGSRLAVRLDVVGRARVTVYLLRDERRIRLTRRRLSGRHRITVKIAATTRARRYRILACVGPGRGRCRRSGHVAVTAPAPAAASPTIGGCPIFPADSPWNRDVSSAPVDPASATLVQQALGHTVHLDLGDRQPEYGIPFSVVPEGQPLLPILFGTDGADYSDESDRGPFPIPPDAPIEGGTPARPDPDGGDRHVLVLQQGRCLLYELYNAVRVRDSLGVSAYRVSSSARWDLRSNARRPERWTSADAAGLPILPGLLRYDEAAGGEIRHALRFTLPRARRAYQAPAGHCGPHADPSLPPYGSRWRLKASFDESPYASHPPALAIVRALKRYGLMFADQGSALYVSGVTDPRWTDTIETINQEHPLPGEAFEVVAGGPITTC